MRDFCARPTALSVVKKFFLALLLNATGGQPADKVLLYD